VCHEKWAENENGTGFPVISFQDIPEHLQWKLLPLCISSVRVSIQSFLGAIWMLGTHPQKHSMPPKVHEHFYLHKRPWAWWNYVCVCIKCVCEGSMWSSGPLSWADGSTSFGLDKYFTRGNLSLGQGRACFQGAWNRMSTQHHSGNISQRSESDTGWSNWKFECGLWNGSTQFQFPWFVLWHFENSKASKLQTILPESGSIYMFNTMI